MKIHDLNNISNILHIKFIYINAITYFLNHEVCSVFDQMRKKPIKL